MTPGRHDAPDSRIPESLYSASHLGGASHSGILLQHGKNPHTESFGNMELAGICCLVLQSSGPGLVRSGSSDIQGEEHSPSGYHMSLLDIRRCGPY